MITLNVITRVFYLKNNGIGGTCFTIDIDNKQYFVTAKHIVESINDSDNIELYRDNWQSYEAKIVGHSEIADVSVFTLDIFFDAYPLPASITGIIFGQDIFYLGFPFDSKTDIWKLNRGFLMPAIKKGILSAISLKKEEGKWLLIDSISAPGFSGGPVIFSNLKNKNIDYKVCGVISKTQFYPVDNKDEDGVEYSYLANTGITTAYSIDNALDLIKLNPIGKKFLQRKLLKY